MTQASDYTFLAVFTTLSPMHITEPANDRIALNGRLTSEGFPYARTAKLSVAPTPLVSSITEEVKGEGIVRVPCIPANTLAGLLRRRSARLIMKHLVARGEQLSTNAYNVLECGAATGKPDSKPPSVKEVVSASAHPYFGLHGGGPRLFRKKLRVDTALALTDASKDLVHPHFSSIINEPRDRLLGTVWQRRNDDLLHVCDSDMQTQIIADPLAAINAYQDARASSKSNDAQTENEKSSDLVRFNALEYVVPGAHFALRLDVPGATQAQAGLLLSSLLELVKLNRIGGQGRRGFGRFMLQNVILERDGETLPIASRLGEKNQSISQEGQSLIAQWEAECANITAGEIEAYAKSLDVEKEKKNKATPKEAATPEA